MLLTFKWNAILKNGETIPQFEINGQENSFGLVQEQDRLKQLKRFELLCVDDGLPHLAVDLETGYLEIRGNSFHPYNSLSIEPVCYRIIFYRQPRARLEAGKMMQWIHRYLLGWQCTYNGLNYQRFWSYDPTSAGVEIKTKR